MREKYQGAVDMITWINMSGPILYIAVNKSKGYCAMDFSLKHNGGSTGAQNSLRSFVKTDNHCSFASFCLLVQIMLPSDDRGKWVSDQIITNELSKLRLSEVTALSGGING